MPRKKRPQVEEAEVVKEFPAPAEASPKREYWGKGKAHEFLERFGEDSMIESVCAGSTISELASDLGVPVKALSDWIGSKESRRHRFLWARAVSAEAKEIEAYRHLDTLPPTATPAEVARAKELAAHCRWQATKRNPDTYGEKRQLTVKHDVGQLSDAELEAETRRLLEAVTINPEPDRVQ